MAETDSVNFLFSKAADVKNYLKLAAKFFSLWFAFWAISQLSRFLLSIKLKAKFLCWFYLLATVKLWLAGFESWLKPVAKNNHSCSYLKSIHCNFLVSSHASCLSLGSVLFLSWFCVWLVPAKKMVFPWWSSASRMAPAISHLPVQSLMRSQSTTWL